MLGNVKLNIQIHRKKVSLYIYFKNKLKINFEKYFEFKKYNFICKSAKISSLIFLFYFLVSLIVKWSLLI